jgi:hypothetical protein
VTGPRTNHDFVVQQITDGETARERQAASRMSYRQNRSRKTAERVAEHDAIVNAVSTRLATTASNKAFVDREVSVICRTVVRQMADLINSQVLVPTTAKEAAEIAKVFSQIDHADMTAKALKKAAAGGAIDVDGLSMLPSADRERLLEVVARGRARQVQAGQVMQVGDVEDSM